MNNTTCSAALIPNQTLSVHESERIACEAEAIIVVSLREAPLKLDSELLRAIPDELVEAYAAAEYSPAGGVKSGVERAAQQLLKLVLGRLAANDQIRRIDPENGIEGFQLAAGAKNCTSQETQQVGNGGPRTQAELATTLAQTTNSLRDQAARGANSAEAKVMQPGDVQMINTDKDGLIEDKMTMYYDTANAKAVADPTAVPPSACGGSSPHGSATIGKKKGVAGRSSREPRAKRDKHLPLVSPTDTQEIGLVPSNAGGPGSLQLSAPMTPDAGRSGNPTDEPLAFEYDLDALEEVAARHGYKLHHVADAFPFMSPIEYLSLREAVRQYSRLRVPILTWKKQVIDGRHRLYACMETGVTPTFEEWNGEGSLVVHVSSLNVCRRDLNPSLRATTAVELLPSWRRRRRSVSASTARRPPAARGKHSWKVFQECPAARPALSLRIFATQTRTTCRTSPESRRRTRRCSSKFTAAT